MLVVSTQSNLFLDELSWALSTVPITALRCVAVSTARRAQISGNPPPRVTRPIRVVDSPSPMRPYETASAMSKCSLRHDLMLFGLTWFFQGSVSS